MASADEYGFWDERPAGSGLLWPTWIANMKNETEQDIAEDWREATFEALA